MNRRSADAREGASGMCRHIENQDVARFVVLSLVLACACAGPRAGVADKATGIIALDFSDNQDLSRIPRRLKSADKFVDSDFAADKLQSYPAETLKLLLKSLNKASFYSYGAARYVSLQEKVFDELTLRRLQTADDVERMFQKYLSARMFDKAEALKSRFPASNLWSIPRIVELNEPRSKLYKVYDVSDDSQTATVRHLPVEAGPKIVIAAFGACPVTSRALKYLETDKDLLRALQTNGAIVTARFEPAGVAYLNSQFSAARLSIAYEIEDWPGIDFSSSPTFYFLKDGKILHQFVGWGPAADSIREFNKGLRLIGLKNS